MAKIAAPATRARTRIRFASIPFWTTCDATRRPTMNVIQKTDRTPLAFSSVNCRLFRYVVIQLPIETSRPM